MFLFVTAFQRVAVLGITLAYILQVFLAGRHMAVSASLFLFLRILRLPKSELSGYHHATRNKCQRQRDLKKKY